MDDDDFDELEDSDDTVSHAVRVPKKVEIIITETNDDGTPCQYSDGVVRELDDGTIIDKSNKPYTSVGFSTNTYGASGGCDSEEDIARSIQWYKETIIKEGDIPVVIDKRKKATLANWFGG